MNLKKWKKKDTEKEEKQLVEGSKEYDAVIIDLTRERISQEFDNVAADELKGSIIIGAVAAIIGIILTVHEYMKFLSTTAIQHLSFDNFAWLPLGLIASAFYCGSVLVYSREKLRLVKPRETNNDYSKLNPIELKKKLKEELIENFEFIENKRKHNWIYINAGFLLLIAGVTGIFITLLLISKNT
ncbi:MAG: hypothetical protein KGI02_08145 [Thaumarchaeota archaeon]|nr:hypothetical protein [Nitrososphaerota archaeon]